MTIDSVQLKVICGGKDMKKIDSQAEKIMLQRFGKDSVIALATVENDR